MAASPPCPSSLTFSPHTVELNAAQNNLEAGVGGGVGWSGGGAAVPRLSPSWELIQLSKCPFASIRLQQTGRKSEKLGANKKGQQQEKVHLLCKVVWRG